MSPGPTSGAGDCTFPEVSLADPHYCPDLSHATVQQSATDCDTQEHLGTVPPERMKSRDQA